MCRTLKPVSLTFFDVDTVDDNETAGNELAASPTAATASQTHSPIINTRDELMDVDTTLNNTAGAAEDIGIPLSLSFDSAQSLLIENHTTTAIPLAASGLQGESSNRPSPAAVTITPIEPQLTATATTDIHTTTAVTAGSSEAPRTVDAQGKTKKTKGDRKKRVYPNSITPEYVASLACRVEFGIY
jgi:hypothetical protein